MDSKIPKGGIHKMNDAELQAAISRAEARERATRNLLSELRLHQLMRKNV